MSKRSASHAKNQRAQAKSARRKKRLAARDTTWLPAEAAESIELDDFDELLGLRGWTYDEENSADGLITWFYAPSGVATVDAELEAVTRLWVTAEDDGELVHLVLVGTAEEVVFEPDDLVQWLDTIEGHRLGEAVPTFE